MSALAVLFCCVHQFGGSPRAPVIIFNSVRIFKIFDFREADSEELGSTILLGAVQVVEVQADRVVGRDRERRGNWIHTRCGYNGVVWTIGVLGSLVQGCGNGVDRLVRSKLLVDDCLNGLGIAHDSLLESAAARSCALGLGGKRGALSLGLRWAASRFSTRALAVGGRSASARTRAASAATGSTLSVWGHDRIFTCRDER